MRLFILFNCYLLFVSSLNNNNNNNNNNNSLLFCNNASEPTFGDIFNLISPVKIQEIQQQLFHSHNNNNNNNNNNKINSFSDIILNVWSSFIFQFSQSFYNTKVPLAFIVSDGVFTIQNNFNELINNKILIIKKKHWIQRYFYQIYSFLFGVESSNYFTSFFDCWKGTSLILYYGKDRAQYFNPEGSTADWCVYTEPCNEKYYHESTSSTVCNILVDPFVTSCIPSSKFSYLSENEIEKIISYQLQVRTLKSQKWDYTFTSFLEMFCNFLQTVTSKDSGIHEKCFQFYDYIRDNILSVLCSWIPVYLLNTLIAIIFLSVEDSVASHPLFRFLVAVIIGIFLGLLWVFIVIYRLSREIFKTDSIPLIGSFIQPGISAAFVGLSFMFTSKHIQQYFLLKILEFWNDGIFGFSWFGKVYFLLSVSLSLFVTYQWHFFEEGTFSHTLLRLLLRSLGSVMLFLQCSPNPDVCIALGIAALLRDYILEFTHYLWITIEASRQTPTIKYSGQEPLSMTEYEIQGETHTAAELAKLRQFLETPEGQTKLARIKSKWQKSEHRDDLYEKMDLFLKRKYKGRPSKENPLDKNNDNDDDLDDDDLNNDFDDENENEKTHSKRVQSAPKKRTWRQFLFTLIFYASICVIISTIVTIFANDIKGSSNILNQIQSFLQQIGVLRHTQYQYHQEF